MPEETARFAQREPKSEIQLLPEEKLREEPVSAFLEWALTVGRWVVIFTEAIVLFVFLARFKLDSDIQDLKQIILGKTHFVQSASDFEKEFKAVQAKLFQLDGLQKETSPLKSEIFAKLQELIPLEVSLKKLILTKGTFVLSGFSDSYPGVMTFLNGLENEEKFSKITLTNLSRDEETGKISFGIQGEVK